MAVLSDTSIRKFQNDRVPIISPFYSDALEPASYDMRLFWKILVSPTRHENGKIIDLRDEPEQSFSVPSGRFVAILTEETLTLPATLSGRFGLRSEFTRQGLVAFPGIQVDPGFHGRLAISLFNTGPEPIVLKNQAKMFTIEFHTLDAPAEQEYSGSYQNQDDFPDDQKEFILNAHTVSFQEITSFPTELASFERRLAHHEALHQTGNAPLSVTDLAKAQDVVPLHDLRELRGGWPEDEDINDFLEAVRSWRGR